MNDTLKKANLYLNEGQSLNSILNKIKKIEQLNKKILSLIDPGMRQYCQLANYTSQRLVLIVANSSIATQLRYQTPELLKKIHLDPDMRQFQEIQYKINMPSTELSRLVKKYAGKAPVISEETADVIRELAKSIDDDKLRRAMEKIAESATKLPQE